jgi:alpha-L-rhamnosidase
MAFSTGKWIWTPGAERRNHFALFTRSLPVSGSPVVRVRMTASYHYELYINGVFVNRGPVHGDPNWCQYDELVYVCGPGEDTLDIAVVVHHSSGKNIHYLLPAPPGLIAEFAMGETWFGTDESWKCLDLDTWQDNTPERNWALDYCEDYDAAPEPAKWETKRFFEADTATWPAAVLVYAPVWKGYTPRPVPLIRSGRAVPARFWAYRASDVGTENIGDCSRVADEESLVPVPIPAEHFLNSFHLIASVNALLPEANAFTFDLGREWVGHYAFRVSAPAGTVIEISGAELLQNGPLRRPWIFRKGCRYTVRYRAKESEKQQEFYSFSWTGCRYLHVVVRGSTEGVEFHDIALRTRSVPLARQKKVILDRGPLADILNICWHTLEVSAQEHLIDCPSREQTQYWGDGVFIAQTYWKAFGEETYLRYYLDCFLHAPLNEHGQLSAKYPGNAESLLDYSLIPLIGQEFYKENTGTYYKPAETLEKALRLKEWFDRHLDENGLVTFDYEAYAKQGLRTFIDHPGIGWHDFPHPGIDRDGTSCPLNTFFYGFLRIAADLAAFLGRPEASGLYRQADRLAEALLGTFFDGSVYHDAIKDGALSAGTSWHTNCLFVYFDLVKGDAATQLMQKMLEGYNHLCRCSPYFHFFLLPALRKAGLEKEALALLPGEWKPMLNAGATTAWEGFLGDAKDSLCHPWSTAPLLFFLEA